MSFIKSLFINDIKAIDNNRNNVKARDLNIAWPSESMAQLGQVSVGSCKREVFYKILGSTPTEKFSLRGQATCDAGLMYEEYHINRFREAKMFVDEQIRIRYTNPETANNIMFSGKMDLVIKSNGKKIGIEIKSISAWKGEAIMGSDRKMGLPASKNLMQAMVYKHYLSHTDEGRKLGIDDVYLMYVNRSDGTTFYYKVDLNSHGYAIITAIDASGKELYTKDLEQYPSFDQLLNQPLIADTDSGRLAELRISITDIFSKFDLTYTYARSNSLPPTDYKLVYTPEDLEREYKCGRLSKIKYNKAIKGTAPCGDYQCTYCSYLTKCLTDSGINLKQ